LTHQLFNNIKIAVNCTKIAIKYVNKYLIFSRNVICVGILLSDVRNIICLDPLRKIYQV